MGKKKSGRKRANGSDRRFGLLPIPPLTSPFATNRSSTTEILWLPIVPTVIAVGTTSYANALNITAASVFGFSNYGAVWEEYVVRAIEWDVKAMGSQIGCMKYYIDEADNSTPTATTAKSHLGWVVRCNGASGDGFRCRWTAKDCGDESWVACSNSSKFITSLKIFSNTADWGLVGTAEAVASVVGWAAVQFRTQGGA